MLLILVVCLLVLGPKRLPEAARSLAKFLAKWRLAFNKIKTDIETEIGMEDIRRELHNEEVMKEIGRIEAEVSEIDKFGNNQVSTDEQPEKDGAPEKEATNERQIKK